MLHITNGESAAAVIRAAGLPGEILAWNDILHDGPVPPDISFNQLRAIRARFIFDCGWRTFEEALREFADRDRALERSLGHEEVVLWFEHDLYDQLQLLQLLDWFATCELGATRLTLICGAEFLGPSTPARLAERFPERRPVSDAELDTARTGWRAFRSENPADIETCLAANTMALPFLRDALVRQLEQFPSTVNGLSRTEQQTVRALSAGTRTAGDLFRIAAQENEAAPYLGDLSFAMYLTALSTCPFPLLLTANSTPLRAPTTGVGRPFWQSELHITDIGRAVLAGKADHVRLNEVDRWFGGVHLVGSDAAWRWDPATMHLKHTP